MIFEKFLVVGGGWVGVSVIIASALVLLRQELRPVLETGPKLDNCKQRNACYVFNNLIDFNYFTM